MSWFGNGNGGQEKTQVPVQRGAQPVPGWAYQNEALKNGYSQGSKWAIGGYDDTSEGMSEGGRRLVNAMQTNFLGAQYGGNPFYMSAALSAEGPGYARDREERVLDYLSETGTDSNIGLPPEEVLIERCPKVGEARAPGVNKFYEEWFSEQSAQKPGIPDQILEGTGAFQPFGKFYLEKQKEMLSDGLVEEVAQRVQKRMDT